MENFFYNDNFYTDLSELANEVASDYEGDIIPDDAEFELEVTELDKIVQLSPDWIVERLDEDKFSEDPDADIHRIENVLKKHIDFEKLNADLPSLYYGTGKTVKITGKELNEC